MASRLESGYGLAAGDGDAPGARQVRRRPRRAAGPGAMARPMRRAVFLDRDGTLVRDVRHGADPAALELLTGVLAALRCLRRFGYLLVVASNQSVVARGLCTLGESRAVGSHLAALLAAGGVRLDGYYLCPHHPDGAVDRWAVACDCRKPAPGLLLRAGRDLAIDLARSWIVGDSPSDVAAGLACGSRAILVATGAAVPSALVAPGVLLARNLPHAAAIALGADACVGSLPAELQPMSRPAAVRAVGGARRAVGKPSPWPGLAWARSAERDERWLAALDTLPAAAPGRWD